MPTINPEPLTIESLARSIHEDMIAANQKVMGRKLLFHNQKTGEFREQPAYDQLTDEIRNIRREQARLMLNRWMR